MAAVLSSPTPSFPSATLDIVTPPLLGSPQLSPDDEGERVPSASSSPSSVSNTASEPSTPTGHSNLVPAYPYNVAMTPAAVHGGPLPDDSEVTTRLPSICVDYLSHDWAEDDVWTSWKAMTRHKAEIANGVRLENASWRTWAKQRGNLKTVSPETLNWLARFSFLLLALFSPSIGLLPLRLARFEGKTLISTIAFLCISFPLSSRRLKDSDVTWLYGPLHTAVEAVPPPREATANERLGLEPLRSLSDSKKTNAKADAVTQKSPSKEPASPSLKKKEIVLPNINLQKRRGSEREYKTKPILKYRSLSDILMPQGQPTSPVIEQLGMDFEDQATISVHHARSDSHLVRLNSLNRHRKRTSPLHSPGSSSPERTASDSSSAAGAGDFLRKAQKKRDRRHISFNHRVEQCIAIDSAEERSTYSTAASSDEDEEDDVLTFGARSPRHTTFARQPLVKPEPHTIAWLGPTTLKSVEIYPAPSPAVVFASDPTEYDDSASSPPDSSFGHVEQYNDPEALRRQQQIGQQALMGYQANARSQFDPEDDDDYSMGFDGDYFGGAVGGGGINGPDVGVGDEYDMARYGSTHLVGGSHNNYGQGSSGAHSSSYLGGGPYSPTSPYNPNSQTLAPDMYSASPTSSVPHFRDAPPSSRFSDPSDSSNSTTTTGGSDESRPTPSISTPSVSTASVAIPGPHSPTSATPPKRSALKGGRSRENSNDSTPSSSGAASPSLSASTSPPTGLNAIATAIPPHVRPAGARRTSSQDGSAEGLNGERGRGRSASRGSSSSLEREASANRRTSSSISPTSSGSGFLSAASGTYPGGGGAVGGPVPIAIQPRGSQGGSYDSLSSVMNGGGAAGNSSRGFLADVPEDEVSGAKTGLGRIVTSSSVDSMGSLGSFGAPTPTSPTFNLPSPARSRISLGSVADPEDDDDGMVEDVGGSYPSAEEQRAETEKEQVEAERKKKEVLAAGSTPAPATLPSSSSSAAPPSLPSSLGQQRSSSSSIPTAARLRNASPSTSSGPAKTQQHEDGHGQPSQPTLSSTAAIPSPPIPSDDGPSKTSAASSYARRSLLKAASRGSSDGQNSRRSTSGSRERLGVDSVANSTISAGAAGDHEYQFGADDGVGKGIDLGGTARDFIGAISKGIWGSLNGSSSSSGGGGSDGGSRRSSSSGGGR